MNPSHWRTRVEQEDELLQQLRTLMAQSGQRRAAALTDGVTELGTIDAVAQALGISRPAVSKAIRKHRPAAAGPATTP
jgi:DNA-binding transcriptional regulator GbsR (MarR family)